MLTRSTVNLLLIAAIIMVLSNFVNHWRIVSQSKMIIETNKVMSPTLPALPTPLPIDKKPNITTLVFLHLPKTGGTTVRKTLESSIEKAWSLEWLQNVTNKVGRYRIRTDFNLHPTPHEVFTMTNEQRSHIRFVTGHIPYFTCPLFAQPCKYITILRDPRKRMLSEVRFLQKSFPHLADLTVNEFIEKSIEPGSKTHRYCPLLDNHMTRLLSGDSFENIYGIGDRKLTPCLQLSDRHKLFALQNVLSSEMLLAGVLEQISSFFFKLSSLLEIEIPYSGTIYNENTMIGNDGGGNDSGGLSKKSLQLLEEFTKYDQKVYDAVKQHKWNLP